MKKIILTFAFAAFSLGANAQQDDMDRLQQQPPRETQAALEKAAARDAKKTQEETIQAEKKAKKQEEKAKKAAQKEAEALEKRENKAKNESEK